jgi:hypothetical protein
VRGSPCRPTTAERDPTSATPAANTRVSGTARLSVQVFVLWTCRPVEAARTGVRVPVQSAPYSREAGVCHRRTVVRRGMAHGGVTARPADPAERVDWMTFSLGGDRLLTITGEGRMGLWDFANGVGLGDLRMLQHAYQDSADVGFQTELAWTRTGQPSGWQRSIAPSCAGSRFEGVDQERLRRGQPGAHRRRLTRVHRWPCTRRSHLPRVTHPRLLFKAHSFPQSTGGSQTGRALISSTRWLSETFTTQHRLQALSVAASGWPGPERCRSTKEAAPFP